jgi:hypothetical protein
MEHPTIQRLTDLCTDLISIGNDLYSYNVECVVLLSAYETFSSTRYSCLVTKHGLVADKPAATRATTLSRLP